MHIYVCFMIEFCGLLIIFFLVGSIFFCAKDEMFRFSGELGSMNI